MRTRLWTLAVILLPLTKSARTQELGQVEKKVIQISQSNLDAVSSKVTEWNAKLERDAKKELDRVERAERKLLAKAQRLNNGVVGKLDELIKVKPSALLSKSLGGIAGGSGSVYLAKLDSLNVATQLLKSGGSISGQELAKLESLQKSMGQISQKINSYHGLGNQLNERISAFNANIPGASSLKDFKRLQNVVADYKGKISVYKDLFNEPDKHLDLVIRAAAEIPGFRKYFNRYSQLAGMFDLTSLEGNGNAQDKPGLQTKAMVASMVNERMGIVQSKNSEVTPPGVQNAQGTLSEWKEKLILKGFSGTDQFSSAAFNPSYARRKTLLQHLELGTTFQTQRSTSYFPVITDIGLTLGYKLNERAIVGIGGAFKMGWGHDWQHIRLSGQGFNVKSYIDVRMFGGIYVSGGYERNYLNQITQLRSVAKLSDWQESGLIGVKKSVKTNSSLFKKTSISLLWDFLSYYQVPRMQPFVFRFGYGF